MQNEPRWTSKAKGSSRTLHFPFLCTQSDSYLSFLSRTLFACYRRTFHLQPLSRACLSDVLSKALNLLWFRLHPRLSLICFGHFGVENKIDLRTNKLIL